MKLDRSTLLVYAAELGAGIGLALGFLLLLLWGLHAVFPDATGLGAMVRSRQEAERRQTRIDLEPSGPAVVAVLSNVLRDVRDKPASSITWSAAEVGRELEDRHAVQSYERSGATITFDETNRLQLGEKSLIVVRRPRRVRGVQRAAVLFMDGFLKGRFGGGQGDEVVVEVMAGGGAIRAARDGDRPVEIDLAMYRENPTLAVHEGTAEIAWGDELTEVPSGFSVAFDQATPPGRPVPLPRAPEMRSPAEGRSFGYRSAPPRVRFDWAGDEAATSYRLEIVRDSAFDDLVYEDELAQPGFVHGNLESGTYFWRIHALRGGVAGLPGEARSFRVERDAQEPVLTVEFPEGIVTDGSFVLRGQAEPGSRVFVSDVPIPVEPSGRFEHALRLTDGYNFLVVQAVDPVGNTTFRTHTIHARLANLERAP